MFLVATNFVSNLFLSHHEHPNDKTYCEIYLMARIKVYMDPGKFTFTQDDKASYHTNIYSLAHDITNVCYRIKTSFSNGVKSSAGQVIIVFCLCDINVVIFKDIFV